MASATGSPEGGEDDFHPGTARNWYRGWQAQCQASGYHGLQWRDFVSQLRAEGAMSVLGALSQRDPDKLAYDPDYEMIEDLRARLAIADAWLRGELDRRPMPHEIRHYERVHDYQLPELEAGTG